MLNQKNMQPRILYPARLSFKIEGEIKSFPDKQKLKEFRKIRKDQRTLPETPTLQAS